MFLTVHATAGLVIGQYVDNFWLALLAGFFSHFLIDAIPHGDNNFIIDKFNFQKEDIELLKKFTIADGSIVAILFFCLYWFGLVAVTLPIIAAIAGSIFPDFLTGVYILTKNRWLKKFYTIHLIAHETFKKIQVSFAAGLMIQIIFCLILLAIAIVK